MNEFERTRIWNKMDNVEKDIIAQGKCIAKIKQYIEDKEKSTNTKMTVFGIIIGSIAVGIAILK